MKSYEDTFLPDDAYSEREERLRDNARAEGYDAGHADGRGEAFHELKEAIALLRRWEAWDMNDAHRDFQLSPDTVIWLRDHTDA